MKGDLLKTLLKLSIPSSINMILISLSELPLFLSVNDYGSQATVRYGVVNQGKLCADAGGKSRCIAVSIFCSTIHRCREYQPLERCNKNRVRSISP
ncbi:hypothetical protein ACEQPO_15810 [Bacillus sp. SL00103]